MGRESQFEAELVDELEDEYPGSFVLKIDPSLYPGFPDRIMIFENKWAAFDLKARKNSRRRPNQEYYIRLLNSMSYATFVYPENKETFLNELQQTFRPNRRTRLSGRKQTLLG